MSGFFVYRPVLAWVVAILVVLSGALALRALPVELYPDIAPPSITIHASFVGADAQTVDRTVTSVIEQGLSGVDDLLHIASTSRANGSSSITLSFRTGTDMDSARAQVQERLSWVDARLPDEVRQMGVRVLRPSMGFLMMIALQSEGGARDVLELGDFANASLVDELRRVNGVGDVMLFGSAYAMRIWLDRDRLIGHGISAAEAMAAVREQNAQAAGGGIGLQPVVPGTESTAQIVMRGRLSTPEQFRQIIIRSSQAGALVRLGDVARVELGNDSYAFGMRLNGEPAVGLAVVLTSGANALSTANGVKARLRELERSFPRDVRWTIPFDSSPFIAASVSSVLDAIVMAMVLVSIMVLLFLQSWRAMFLPTIVVPISLVGACLGLFAFGFTINLLSLFAMVVAIGILNDDAIVIVENVERIMREEGLEAREATAKAMEQLFGAIIATSLVLLAVFIPMGFFPGSAGGIYRQFSVTLSVSLVVSTVLSLTLAPAICGAMLRPPGEERTRRGPLRRVFDAVNRWLERAAAAYARVVERMIGRPLPWLVGFLAAVALTALLYLRLPGGFLPDEDQGVVFANYIAAPGATRARTEEAIARAETVMRAQPEVRNIVSVTGFSFFGQGQGVGISFIDLHPWSQRRAADEHALRLAQRLNMALAPIPQAQIFVLNPPAIPSLGTGSGFSMRVQDRGGAGVAAVRMAGMQLVQRAAASPLIGSVRPDGMPPSPQVFVDIDRVRARALGLSLAQVNQALAVMFGSAYVNDFVHQENIQRVFMQAEPAQRMRVEDIGQMQLPNAHGELVPFSAFIRTHWTTGDQQIDRYNSFLSSTVSGQAAPGVSSGAALREMERLAGETLPAGMGFEWTGTAREEVEAGGQVGFLLALAVLVAFLLLAGLYESWSTPVAVLLIVPLGMLGAVLFTSLRGMSADVYFNVGLIAIIGLAAKNAILIIQFAIDEEARGVPLREAVLDASLQRFRPILMTSLTFLVGMLPLVFASGAGAASRQAVGTGVVGSMFTATALGIFYTPVFYYLIRRRVLARRERQALRRAEARAAAEDDDA